MLQSDSKTILSPNSGSKKTTRNACPLSGHNTLPSLALMHLYSNPVVQSLEAFQRRLAPFYSKKKKEAHPLGNTGPLYSCVMADNFSPLIFSAFLGSTAGDVSFFNLFVGVSKRHVLCNNSSKGCTPANSNKTIHPCNRHSWRSLGEWIPRLKSDACTLRGSCSIPGGKWVERSLGGRLSCNFIWTRWLRGRCVGG